MEGIIKVTPEQLISTSGEFESEATQIGNLTTQMMNLIASMSGSWAGEAASAYVAKFNGLNDDIGKLVKMVQEHSTDLETMAQNYIAAEKQNEEMAASLASDVIV